MMRHFHRCHRGPARLDGVEEVAKVSTLGQRQFHLALVLLEDLGVFPLLVRGFKGFAAIDPDPAVGADPLGAAANVRMSASDDQGDVSWILGRDAVLGAGVPNCIGRRKLARALDFERADLVVVSQTPMRDVAVMPDPVEQLAAAGIVIPAPVHVHARLDVRLHFRRADPGRVIQFRRRFGDGDIPTWPAGHNFGQLAGRAGSGRQLVQQCLGSAGEVVVAAGQTHLDAGHFSNQSVPDDFRAIVEVSLGPLPRTGLPYALVFLNGFHNGLLLGHGAGERLFAVDVLFVSRRLGGNGLVPMIRHGDHHGVDVRPRHHFAVIVIRFAILVLVVPIDGVHRRREMVFVNVTRRDHLAVRFSHEIAGIARTLHAPADDAHGDAFRGSRAPIRSQRAGGDDGRCRHGGGGGGNKAAAGNLGIDGFHGQVLCPTRHP